MRGAYDMGRSRSRSARDILSAVTPQDGRDARSIRRGLLVGPNSILSSPNRNPIGRPPSVVNTSGRSDMSMGQESPSFAVWWRGSGPVGRGYIPRLPVTQEATFGPAVPVTDVQVKMGLPPGVVVYPTGRMTLTATTGAKFVPHGNYFECLQFETGPDGDTMRVLERINYTAADLVKLRDAAHTLRMTWPVRLDLVVVV